MENLKQKKVSRKHASYEFTTIGLCLVLYAFLILIIPSFIKRYFEFINSPILNDDFLYIGLYYCLILVGTLIPFLILSFGFKIKVNELFRSVRISTKEVFGEAIVFFTLASLVIFITNSVTSYFGTTSSLLFNIGSVSFETHYDSALYIFITILVCPILEGFAFRGVLIKSLSKYGKKFAIYMSALIYALAHTNFSEMIPAFVIGVMLGEIAVYHKSIQSTVVIHILFNALIVLLCFIPEELMLYMVILLLLVYLVAILLLLSKKYSLIKIKTNETTSKAILSFISTPAIIIAIIIFVSHSILINIFH